MYAEKIKTTRYRLSVEDLETLFRALSEKNYQNIGPVLRDEAIMLAPVHDFHEIASGIQEELEKGTYSIKTTDNKSFFQYTVGPQSFKKFLHPPRRKLWSANQSDNGIQISQPDLPGKMAFWGIRNCDLSAIDILDRVFLKGSFPNEYYKSVRSDLFTVAVGCTHPSSNCFCTSMNGGPLPRKNADIILVEVLQGNEHFFLADFLTKAAKKLLQKCDFPKATKKELTQASKIMSEAEDAIDKKIDAKEAILLLKNNADHPQWEDVASRCLSCANCTLVCPTCFCSTVNDKTDLSGNNTERWLTWDSCFNGDFSYIHGGKIRTTTKSRYRQWMTHKLSYWDDQFDQSGCVGCGRCISWCPVGIDITDELSAIQKSKFSKLEEPQ